MSSENAGGRPLGILAGKSQFVNIGLRVVYYTLPLYYVLSNINFKTHNGSDFRAQTILKVSRNPMHFIGRFFTSLSFCGAVDREILQS